MNNKDKFSATLEKHYNTLFQTSEYAMAAERHTPESMAAKFTNGLLDNSANKDGDGIRLTCKELGIKHTYKAIKEYLLG